MNLTSLDSRFNTAAYLTGHSDIVALMVLEHQGEMHNLLTRASFQTRQALHDEVLLRKELGSGDTGLSDSTLRRIKSAGDPLLRYLLFSGEAPLTEPVRGTSSFTEDFARRGPRDAQGRSLRDFDLEKRLFKYPCSYLIYSPSFDQLPAPVKDYVLRRLYNILQDRDYSHDFDHLTAADRRAILDILRATKPDLPAYWRE